MDSLGKKARVAGLWYLGLAVTGPFNLIYVPGKLIVRGDPAATMSNITAHELLFRADIAVGLVSSILFVFTGLALYRLLESVDRKQAVAMAILVLVSVPVGLANVLNHAAVLVLSSGASYLSVFSADQRQALAMLFLDLDGYGATVEGVFWGLWLFPLALLVYRSGFLPRILGIILIPNGIAYVVASFTTLLMPAHRALVSQLTMPFLFGELAIMLWLVVMGARQRQPASS